MASVPALGQAALPAKRGEWAIGGKITDLASPETKFQPRTRCAPSSLIVTSGAISPRARKRRRTRCYSRRRRRRRNVERKAGGATRATKLRQRPPELLATRFSSKPAPSTATRRPRGKAKRRTPPSRDTSERARRPEQHHPPSASQRRASARSCSPRPGAEARDAFPGDLSPRPRHLQARPRFKAGTLWRGRDLSLVERPGFFASASVGAITSPTKASMGVAGMQLVSSVPPSLCSKRRASEKARMTTHGAL
jgi:hypothetical protein